LRRNGLDIDEKLARNIQYSIYDPGMSGNKIVYNGAEFEIKQNNVDIGFKFKMSGLNLFVKIKSTNFVFNTLKLTLKQLLSKIEEKVKFIFKNGISWSAISQQQDAMNDKDEVKENNKIDLLDKYCSKLEEKFLFYNIKTDYSNKPGYEYIKIDIACTVQDFFDEISDGFGSKRFGWRFDIQYNFQKRDLIRIISLLTSNIKRYYNLELSTVRLSNDDLTIVYRKYKSDVDLEKEFAQANKDDILFKKHLFNKIFEN
ncbi:MAG: hypothetical protein KBC30_11590, partial [Planctomycetes bacterium]|nr:hypothetical protein [Planctomycetota bacterium]